MDMTLRDRLSVKKDWTRDVRYLLQSVGTSDSDGDTITYNNYCFFFFTNLLTRFRESDRGFRSPKYIDF